MASYTHREVIVRRVEYAVPSGDAVAELDKACCAALADYRARTGTPQDGPLYDDWARVEARDDEVAIVFTVEEKPGADTARLKQAQDALSEVIRSAVLAGRDAEAVQAELAPVWRALTGPAEG